MSDPGSALDTWIGRELRRDYDATLVEPLPASLLLMLSRINQSA